MNSRSITWLESSSTAMNQDELQVEDRNSRAMDQDELEVEDMDSKATQRI